MNPMNIYTWIQGRFSPNIDEFSIYCIDLQSLDTDRQPGDGFGYKIVYLVKNCEAIASVFIEKEIKSIDVLK